MHEAMARITILDLLNKGMWAADDARNFDPGDMLARKAVSYLDAATIILKAHPTLHPELLEHEHFNTLRRFRRSRGL